MGNRQATAATWAIIMMDNSSVTPAVPVGPNHFLLSGAGTTAVNGSYTLAVAGDQYDSDTGNGYVLLLFMGVWFLYDAFSVVVYQCDAANFPAGPWSGGSGDAPLPTGNYIP